jgi:serine kinase of HPr protein (carbohydrate metabolism regulator)
LLGKSGIGKSECALELVLRGHRLVADDVVQCDWRPPAVSRPTCSATTSRPAASACST